MRGSALYHAKQNADLILDLPDPPETFTISEYDMGPKLLSQLKSARIIRVAERRPHKTHRWEVDRRAKEVAREYQEEIEGFPCCGGTGFKNRGGDLYCSDCGEPVSRDLAKEVTM